MRKYIIVFMSILLLFGVINLHADLTINIPFDPHVVSDWTAVYQSEYFDVINNGITDSFTIRVDYLEIPYYWSLGWCHEYQGNGSCHSSEYPWGFTFESGDTLKLRFNIMLLQLITSGNSMDFNYTFTASSLPEPVVIDFSFTMTGLPIDNPHSEEHAFIKIVPNPLSTNSQFKFTVNKKSVVSISIYNILGELVKTFPSVITEENEIGSIYWNGKDSNGKELSSGVYFYNFVINNNISKMKRFMIIKQ